MRTTYKAIYNVPVTTVVEQYSLVSNF